MVVRFTLLALIVALASLCALVFEASTRTAIALTLIERAAISPSPTVRTQILAQAQAQLLQSWAQPARWHAGAAEALSGVYYARGTVDSAEIDALTESARWAQHAITLSPIAPNSWIRLAALSERGIANNLCDVRTCLAHSWRAAPLLDGPSGCERLRLGYRAGLIDGADPRLKAFLRIEPRRSAAQCLSFLAPEELYALMMETAGER